MPRDRKRTRNKPQKSRAERADRHALYEKSVQSPDVDVRFLRKAYRRNFGEAPSVLREDFCGTAAVCCEWVKLGKEFQAYGVDLEPEVLAWGTEHNLARLSEKRRERVTLLQGDVRTAETPPADVIAAQNFSYCIFETRDALRAYFERAYANLGDRGILVCDLFGGYESIEDDKEEVTQHKNFDYVWIQDKFDPITHYARFHISFRFSDGSAIEKAFTYEWRLWTIPEVRELMVEAGFERADAYWEGTDKRTGEGTGVYKPTASGDSDPAWNAYIVGVKSS